MAHKRHSPARTGGISSLDWIVNSSMAVGLLLMALWFINAPPAVGLLWDSLMALGLIGALMLALMGVLSPRFWSLTGHEATALLHLHRYLGIAVLVITGVHTLGLLMVEPITIEYLKLRAPGYMLAGIAALIALIALIWPSLRRMAWRMHYRLWQISHAVVSALAVILVGWHVLGSGYGFLQIWKWVLVVIVFAVPTIWIYLWGRKRPEVPWPSYGRETAKGRVALLTARRHGYRWMAFGILISVAAGALRQL